MSALRKLPNRTLIRVIDDALNVVDSRERGLKLPLTALGRASVTEIQADRAALREVRAFIIDNRKDPKQ